jgi:hypothetical protein
VAPIHDQIMSFYKAPGLIRMAFMDVNRGPYYYMARVVATVEKVILTEEARTLGLVIRDIRLIQKRVARAEA